MLETGPQTEVGMKNARPMEALHLRNFRTICHDGEPPESETNTLELLDCITNTFVATYIL